MNGYLPLLVGKIEAQKICWHILLIIEKFSVLVE